MTINQDINKKLIPFSIDLMRVEANLRNRLFVEYKELEKKLVIELRSVDPSGVKRTSYQEARLQNLLKQTTATINSFYRDSLKISNKELVSLVDLTGKSILSSINSAVGFNIVSTTISPALALSIVDEAAIAGLKQNEWFTKMAGDAKRLYTGAIREGINRGETNEQIVKRVVGTRSQKFKDGISKQLKNQIKATVRSSVQNISNAARLKIYDNNSDVISGITWVSTLDSKTSLICMGLDGLSWDKDKKPIGHNIIFPGTTAHVGCRSTQVPILKAYEDMPKNVRDKIPEGQRRKYDGTVAESTNYEEFLRGESVAFQKKQLGANRYRLWKEDKITFTDLIDQSANGVSVEDLLQKFAA